MQTPTLTASRDRENLRRLTRRTSTFVLSVVVSTALLLYGLVSPAGAATRTFTGLGLTGNGQGYLLVSSAGEFYAYGTARRAGCPPAPPPPPPPPPPSPPPPPRGSPCPPMDRAPWRCPPPASSTPTAPPPPSPTPPASPAP